MKRRTPLKELYEGELDQVVGGNAHEPPFGGPQGGGPGGSGPGDKNEQGGGLGPPPKK